MSRSRRSPFSVFLSVCAALLLFGAGLLLVGVGPFLFDPGSVFVVAPLLFGGDLLLFVVGRHLLFDDDLLLLGCDLLLFGAVWVVILVGGDFFL